jgi:hypothetical protein
MLVFLLTTLAARFTFSATQYATLPAEAELARAERVPGSHLQIVLHAISARVRFNET